METELIEIHKLPMRLDDAGEQMKDAAFLATIRALQRIILVYRNTIMVIQVS